MLISNLKGGLGNQLFIYSFIYTLAKNISTSFSFDLSSYNFNLGKSLEIDKVNIVLSQVDKKMLSEFRYNSLSTIHEKLKRKLGIKIYKGNIITEDIFDEISFKKEIKYNKNYYFDGYWQDIKYFLSDYENLNKNFQINKDFIGNNYLYLLNLINSDVNSIAIHIRKSDYLNKKNFKIYENLSDSYYNNAINYFIEKLKKNKIYVFTDDDKWVNQNLILKNAIFVSKYNLTTIEEFSLMSNFKNIILSNSTFSLWASLLNNYNEKQIVVPKKWFKNNNEKKTSKLFTKQMVILEN